MAQSGTALALSGKIQDFENFGLSPKIASSERFPGSNPGVGVRRTTRHVSEITISVTGVGVVISYKNIIRVG